MAELLKADITPNGINQGDLVAFLRNVRDFVNEIKSVMQGNYVLGVPALAGGSNADDIATAAFVYMIGGKQYSKAAVTTGTGPGNDVVPQNTYGAVALDIGADGTLDAIEAAANATGYASAALAVAGLPAAAAGHARVGWVTVIKTDGAFTFGTTNLNASNVTAVFTDAPTLANSIASAALKLTAG